MGGGILDLFKNRILRKIKERICRHPWNFESKITLSKIKTEATCDVLRSCDPDSTQNLLYCGHLGHQAL